VISLVLDCEEPGVISIVDTVLDVTRDGVARLSQIVSCGLDVRKPDALKNSPPIIRKVGTLVSIQRARQSRRSEINRIQLNISHV